MLFTMENRSRNAFNLTRPKMAKKTVEFSAVKSDKMSSLNMMSPEGYLTITATICSETICCRLHSANTFVIKCI